MSQSGPAWWKRAAAVVAAPAWLALVAAWLVRALPPSLDLDEYGLSGRYIDTELTLGIAFGAAALWGLFALRRAKLAPTRNNLLAASFAFLPVWQASVFAADKFDFPTVRAGLADLGLAIAFLIGLVWLVSLVERRWNEYQRQIHAAGVAAEHARIWNPLHPQAWYYGRQSAKLNQSLAVLATYSLLFFALFLLAGQLSGCKEIYELPAGGGQETQIAQTVKIQKIIKKKFVINPYSSVIFKPPPLDDTKLNIMEVTAHKYAIGQGQGDGAGFSGGTGRGKVRFIRLEYSGGDWNQDFGIGADLNMLQQYSARTGQQVADETESRTVAQLSNFPVGKSPPLMYLTGQKQINLSKSEIKILREYLIDKYGMLFIDNGGSSQFHSQAFQMMRQVVPEIEPVRVPLDDQIHRIPYPIPFLPYVAPHGGRDAWGWKMNGRWIAYYHPGDIGDAWSDGHSGVPQQIYEACFQLGTNVIFYAHAEYNKWLAARSQKR